MTPWLSDLFVGSQTDERLVTLARAGQERAFVAIVQRYQRPLLAFARRLDSAGRAEDIVQQSFLSAFAALQAGAEVEHLRGWLYQIVRNSAAKTPNGATEELGPPVHYSAATASLEEQVERRMLAVDALAEISRLPDRQREAIVATVLDGHSRSEVADAMGVSEGAVRQLLHRARATVRTILTAITPYPFAQWFASPRGLRNADRTAEVAVGGGTAAGGVGLKLGAIVVSGAVATGIVVTHPDHHPARVAYGGHPLAAPRYTELVSTAALDAKPGVTTALIARAGPSKGSNGAARATAQLTGASRAGTSPAPSRSGAGSAPRHAVRGGPSSNAAPPATAGAHGPNGNHLASRGRGGPHAGGSTGSKGPPGTGSAAAHGSDGGNGNAQGSPGVSARRRHPQNN